MVRTLEEVWIFGGPGTLWSAFSEFWSVLSPKIFKISSPGPARSQIQNLLVLFTADPSISGQNTWSWLDSVESTRSLNFNFPGTSSDHLVPWPPGSGLWTQLVGFIAGFCEKFTLDCQSLNLIQLITSRFFRVKALIGWMENQNSRLWRASTVR